MEAWTGPVFYRTPLSTASVTTEWFKFSVVNFFRKLKQISLGKANQWWWMICLNKILEAWKHITLHLVLYMNIALWRHNNYEGIQHHFISKFHFSKGFHYKWMKKQKLFKVFFFFQKRLLCFKIQFEIEFLLPNTGGRLVVESFLVASSIF